MDQSSSTGDVHADLFVDHDLESLRQPVSVERQSKQDIGVLIKVKAGERRRRKGRPLGLQG
jgi:hypothetical protein